MAASAFKEYGALNVIECWGDDVPEGKITSFPISVKRKDDETVVFSWIVWPSREPRQAAWEKIMADPGMQPDKNPMPFDGKRMIYGGFEPIVGAPASDTAAVQPCLFFRGRCEEAIGYYKAKLGNALAGGTGPPP